MKRQCAKIGMYIGLSVSLLQCNNSSGGSSSSSNAAAVSTAPNEFPDQYVVAGTLAVSSATEAKEGPIDASNKPIAVVDNNNVVVSQGTTGPNGTFTLAIHSDQLSLAATTSGPRVANIRSLFLAGSKNDAIGVKRQIVLDPKDIVAGAIDVGQAVSKNVGAVVGTVVLETKEDPTGIDVYVPGTTYIAKTNGDGTFILGFLPKGTYHLRADRDGFGSIEWGNVVVGLDETTHLLTSTMRIAKGPTILSFTTSDKSSIALSSAIKLELVARGASKFRISQLSDFRDTEFRVIDATQDVLTIPFEISGSDGVKTIYLELADSDGISINTSIDILLDTAKPVVPTVSVYSSGAQSGYSSSASPLLFTDSCNDIAKFYVTETKSKTPSAEDFSSSGVLCKTAKDSGVSISVSSSEESKSLYVWAIDEANQISAESKKLSLTVDLTSPALVITPPVNQGTTGVLGNETIEIGLATSESTTIYYTFDLSDPTRSSSSLDTSQGPGRLVLIGDATLKAVAYDLAGNASSVTTRQFNIDRNGPILGSITTSHDLINTLTIPLILSAQGATKMLIAENVAALGTGTFIPYSATHNYTLQNTSDGDKVLYAVFSDDAGNLLGKGGETYTTFVLDRTAPTSGKLSLLPPESPTGAFNTPLAWKSDYTSNDNVTFTIEIHDADDYSNEIRSMTTTETTVNASPPLSAEGTYYWRVRAEDQAGNATDWVTSGLTLAFQLRVLAQSVQARKDFVGNSSTDQNFGQHLTQLGDFTTDGIPELAYSIAVTNYADSAGNQCTGCPAVQVLDRIQNTVLATIGENLPRASGFGHRIVSCDIDGDGRDELVVAAPGDAQTLSGVKYNSAGSIYVYETQNFTRVAQAHVDLGSAPVPGWDSCRIYGADPCPEWGWEYWPYPGEYLQGTNGRFFGWDVSCVRSAGGTVSNGNGADAIAVGEPDYSDGTYQRGRVTLYEVQSGALTLTKTILGPNPASAEDDHAWFGASVKYLPRFKYGSCPLGPSLAVGRPLSVTGGGRKGSVGIYQYVANQWTLCDTISATSDDPDYAYYGQHLFNLGDMDHDGTTDELAVSTNWWSGGSIRIFGGSSGTLLKAYRDTGGTLGNLGYQIVPAGDLDSDNISELAFTAPQARVNGQYGAGEVLIFRWSDLTSTSNNTVQPMQVITGRPEQGSGLGDRFIPIVSGATVDSAATGSIIAKPARRINNQYGVGSFHEFAKIKMAPSLPTKMVGDATNAQFGRSLAAIPDIDNDSVPDFMIGGTGALCNGLAIGAANVYSVLDQRMAFGICDQYGSGLGSYAGTASGSNTVLFGNQGRIFVQSPYSISQNRLISNSTVYTSSTYTYMGYSHFEVSPTTAFNSYTDEVLASDADGYNSNLSHTTGTVTLSQISGNFTAQCVYRGQATNGMFGSGVSFLKDVNSDSVREIAIGAPREPVGTSATGRVYIVNGDRTSCTGGTNTYLDVDSSSALFKIDADDPVIVAELGRPANSGFGAKVLGLPDFAGDGKPYLFVSNTNMNSGDSAVIPQYFIFRINADLSITLFKTATGVAGGMLGGNVKLMEDINGDGKAELAIAYPGGIGRFGATGHVEILSGSGLITTSADDDLLQMLFNPEPTANNFGVSIEYADITGDALKDFVIGANKYSSKTFQNAGAVFTFPMEPIKD